MPLDAENFSASTHIFKFKIQKKKIKIYKIKKIKKQKKIIFYFLNNFIFYQK